MPKFANAAELYRYSKATGKRFLLALLMFNILTGFQEKKVKQENSTSKIESQVKKKGK